MICLKRNACNSLKISCTSFLFAEKKLDIYQWHVNLCNLFLFGWAWQANNIMFWKHCKWLSLIFSKIRAGLERPDTKALWEQRGFIQAEIFPQFILGTFLRPNPTAPHDINFLQGKFKQDGRRCVWLVSSNTSSSTPGRENEALL